MRRPIVAVGVALLAIWTAPAEAQNSHLLVIVGLAGDRENGDMFHHWAVTLADTARDRYGLPDESILYLGDDPSRDAKRIDGRATREGVGAAIERLAAQARPGDRVFIVLMGHGTAAAGESRFNLPGPDLSAKDFARLLDKLGAQLVTFVNTASSSGSFVAVLSGRDRAVMTATKTDGERNQTRFGGFFVEALAAGDGDLDKDGRVSMFEAFTYARRRVVESYEKEGQLLTEHAVLDDDGDGKGSEAPGQPGTDGVLARTLFMASDAGSRAALEASADPALRALYEERRAIESRIAALKTSKDRTDPARYEQDLEQLLVELAKKSRAIREKETKK